MDLKGKNAIVTGAGRGIGQATALILAKQGCNVGVNDLNMEFAAQTINKIKEYPVKTIPLIGDVGDYIKVESLAEEFVRQFGKVDILVNNAGYGEVIPFEEITIEQWNNMLKVNLTGTFNWTKVIVPKMKEQKEGKIINMCSIFGLVGAEKWTHYCAAKAGIAGLTKALAKELARFNINVNAIAPGTVESDFHWWMNKEDKLERGKRVPLGRQGTPEEIAFLALYLASKEADFITGQLISPNGGEVIVGI